MHKSSVFLTYVWIHAACCMYRCIWLYVSCLYVYWFSCLHTGLLCCRCGSCMVLPCAIFFHFMCCLRFTNKMHIFLLHFRSLLLRNTGKFGHANLNVQIVGQNAEHAPGCCFPIRAQHKRPADWLILFLLMQYWSRSTMWQCIILHKKEPSILPEAATHNLFGFKQLMRRRIIRSLRTNLVFHVVHFSRSVWS